MSKDDEIKSIAYDLWLKAGKPAGDDWKYWFDAEAIWSARQQTGEPMKKAAEGDYYHCDVCGLRVMVSEECNCSDPCDISCCGVPMKASD
ncbi:MAG TPA: DUF2934 domain-containing protein [Dehalococcoidales bacterium]|nr:DUF2934 domain-containing protein [Dehalococcoidales bacterium]